MKFIFVFLIFVAVDAHRHGKKRCYPVTPVVDPPAPTCETNEVYSACGANGCQSTCENPTLNQVCKAACMAGCVCNEGYLRDANSTCVLAANCPSIEPPPPACGANEVFSACGAHSCLPTCAYPDLLKYCDTAPGCYPGCICNEGYLRDSNGNCVLTANCPSIEPPPPACGANEVFSACGAHICLPTCANPDLLTHCDTAPGCYPGCICNEGYLRDSNGNCVLTANCPSIEPPPPACGANEVFSACGAHICLPTCANPDLLTHCDTAPGCYPGCICNEGYLRDSNGNCVLTANCPSIEPPPPACEANEVFSACGAHICLPTCANPDLLTHCDTAPGCYPGCICNEGYLRDSNGNCVLTANCPSIEPPPPACEANEVFSACGAHICLPTCANPDLLTHCDTAPGCYPGCICNEGYLRDSNGNCVLTANCPSIEPPPPACGANEVFSACGAHGCLPTCANPDLLTHCDTAPGCYPGCICNEGYLRDSNGNCVLTANCPSIDYAEPVSESYDK